MLPFALRRPWLLLRDLWVDRDEPDLDKLRETRAPERFLWAILPHAARTFSACIAMLPAPDDPLVFHRLALFTAGFKPAGKRKNN